MKRFGYGKLAGACFVAGIVLPLFFVASDTMSEAVENVILDVSLILMVASVVFFGVWLCVRWKAGAGKRAEKRDARMVRRELRRQEQAEKMAAYNSPEKKAARKAEQESAKAEMKKVWAAENKREADDKRPVSAVLISTTNRRSAVSTVSRAWLGGAILGPIGAIGGAASGKSSATHATFSVKYATGRTATETVEIHSKRFKELSALLHG